MSRPKPLVIAVGVAVAVAVVASSAWWLVGRGGSSSEDGCDAVAPHELELEVVREFPHDPTAFTQGLVFDGDELWESTGLTGESTLRQIDPDDGDVLRSAALADSLFGEGLAVGSDGDLVQITWTSGSALVWDTDGSDEPKVAGGFSYDGEGWGLAAIEGERFAMTDGSDTVALRSMQDFEAEAEVTIERVGGPSDLLNELEWDGSHLWANRWKSDEILRIDLECGLVDAVVDAGMLVERAEEVAASSGQSMDTDGRDVLNGIAWLGVDVAAGDHFLVTGKHWPVMFEVRMGDSN